ncbi:hypothetical protein C6A37_07025 [Desulfobacteraceae bacterium SEEP-SAG9]|nr:hypothetical protein C6A37_07025 [Desulfobacteraceae bacterium SEEP-SAG9]
MPSTFLKEDQKRIAEAALIVEVGLQVEVITDRQAIAQNILRFDQIILGQVYGGQPQQWSGTQVFIFLLTNHSIRKINT